MKVFALAKKHECVSAFFVAKCFVVNAVNAVKCFAVNKFAVKGLLIPVIITVMIREAVCE